MSDPNASCNLRFSFDSVFIIFLEAFRTSTNFVVAIQNKSYKITQMLYE